MVAVFIVDKSDAHDLLCQPTKTNSTESLAFSYKWTVSILIYGRRIIGGGELSEVDLADAAAIGAGDAGFIAEDLEGLAHLGEAL